MSVSDVQMEKLCNDKFDGLANGQGFILPKFQLIEFEMGVGLAVPTCRLKEWSAFAWLIV